MTAIARCNDDCIERTSGKTERRSRRHGVGGWLGSSIEAGDRAFAACGRAGGERGETMTPRRSSIVRRLTAGRTQGTLGSPVIQMRGRRFTGVLRATTSLTPWFGVASACLVLGLAAPVLADGGPGGRGASTLTTGGAAGTTNSTTAGGAGGVGTIAGGTGGGGGGGGAGSTGADGGVGTDVGCGAAAAGTGGATAGASGTNGGDVAAREWRRRRRRRRRPRANHHDDHEQHRGDRRQRR